HGLGSAVPLRTPQRRVREGHHALQRKTGCRGRSDHLRGHPGGAQRGHRLHEGDRPVSAVYTIPLFLRGQLIADDLVSFGTRNGANQFQAPDMAKYVERLPLKSPGDMSDLYELGFDEILDVLEALGEALDFDANPHLQEAYEASLVANVMPPEM